MSDHDNMQGPAEDAYVQAQAMLDDDAARAARRAAVLGAVAREVSAPAVKPAPRRSILRYGGWLLAASVAGLGAVLAFELNAPLDVRREAAPLTPPVAEAPAEQAAPAVDAEAPAPVVVAAPPPTQAAPPAAPAPVAPAPAPQSAKRASDDFAPPPPVAAPPASPSAFPAAGQGAETVTTPRRAEAPRAARTGSVSSSMEAAAAPPPMAQSARVESSRAESSAPLSPTALGARLRAAAAAGRTEELRTLLANGARVDAVDTGGETALMRAVQARRPAAAAVLRRYGADLDLENRAGRSARDMAQALGDPDIDRALGLAP